jgi:hypothetical protein
MAHDIGNPPPRKPWHGVTLPIPEGYHVATEAELDTLFADFIAELNACNRSLESGHFKLESGHFKLETAGVFYGGKFIPAKPPKRS